ncbi:MAG: hypothetical protein ACFFED_14005 [Candidatus Thorarchaeota archaeon]
MASDSAHLRLIDRELRQIEIETKGIVQRFPLKPIPDDLYEAIAGAVDVEGEPEEKMRTIYASTIMKPTVSTFNFDTPFYINSAVKIARLTLRDEIIEEKIEELEGRLLSLAGIPFNETIEERIEMYRDIFIDDKKIDRFRFGVAEMYGDATYMNIRRDPRACLNLYWRDGKDNTVRSYQINVIAEIVPPGTPYYRYMRVLRTLFASKFLDSRRDSYVAAYKFWVSDILDKSLVAKTGFVLEPNNS